MFVDHTLGGLNSFGADVQVGLQVQGAGGAGGRGQVELQVGLQGAGWGAAPGSLQALATMRGPSPAEPMVSSSCTRAVSCAAVMTPRPRKTCATARPTNLCRR